MSTSGNVIIMAYIGGIGHFAGPILGAILLTLLQTLLSNYTYIWGFYVGLVFVATVMFAPNGLAGAIAAHIPVWQANSWRTLLRPYGISLCGVIVTSTGVIGLLEMASFLNEAGVGETRFWLFGISVNTATYASWGGFGVLVLIGVMVLRQALPTARDAWEHAAGHHHEGPD